MKSELKQARQAATRWMVVDDDEGVREFVRPLLEMISEVEVCSFPSALEALSAFEKAPDQFQMILTDFEMPQMNGFEFCRRVLALAPETKVLLVTGDVAIDEADVRRRGFCGLVRKPFPAAALQFAVAAVQT